MFDREKLVALKQPHIAEKWAEWGGAQTGGFARAFEDTPLQRFVGAPLERRDRPIRRSSSFNQPSKCGGRNRYNLEGISRRIQPHGVDLLQQGRLLSLSLPVEWGPA